MPKPGRYAVVFKSFHYDDFVARRLAQVVASAPSGDVFILVDETRAAAGPIPFDRVIRYREEQVVALGLPAISKGPLLWYNADYSLYYFQHLHPDYDYFAVVEYDAVPNINLDVIIDACRADALDFVGQPIVKPLDIYWWTKSMLRFYARPAIRPALICAAVFSARAARHLAARRIEHGSTYDLPDARQWPIGEAYVGTELALQDFRMRDLSSFGRLQRYDWWPPVHEAELRGLGGEVFVHPVLTGRRYVMSLFKSGIVSGFIVIAKTMLRPIFGGRRTATRQPRSTWEAVPVAPASPAEPGRADQAR